MMINYLGGPGRLTLHDDLNYGRKTKLPDAGRARARAKDAQRSVRRSSRARLSFLLSFLLPSLRRDN